MGIKAHIIAFIELSVGLEVFFPMLLAMIMLKEVIMKKKIGKNVKTAILSCVGSGFALLLGNFQSGEKLINCEKYDAPLEYAWR